MVDGDGVEARADRLAALVAVEAEQAERDRRLTDPVMSAAAESGLFSMAVPVAYGGEGAGLRELLDTTRTIAAACPASAWTLSFFVLHNWLLTRFPEQLQAEVFGPCGYGLVPAPLAPTGQLREVDGGWEVSGRWEWATGVNHADWVMVHGLEARDDTFALRFAVLPIGDVEVDDVWHTSGMRATGSNTVRVDGVFVPDHRTLPSEDLLEDRAPEPGNSEMAALPVMAVLSLVASAPALGAAEAAVEHYADRIRERVLAYTLGDKAIDQPAAQVRLGHALAQVRAARVLFEAAADQLLDAVTANDSASGGSIGLDVRMDVRLAAANVVRLCNEVISLVCAGAGASVYQLSQPLQRLQRDVEVLKGHVVFDWDRTTELAGRIELGLPLRPADRI